MQIGPFQSGLTSPACHTTEAHAALHASLANEMMWGCWG
jgi:hypothetical protein